ncbi:AMP-binding protein [Actinomadura sp. LOL_016]|uniref:AMP-binding protein n=1 Tax=unclassified Actinomadura TaxID=2626254 RepID=UPI003A7F6ADC
MTRTYNDLVLNFPDPETRTLGHVLSHHAARTPEATFLIAPEEQDEFTYAETFDRARRVFGGFATAGAVRGDRVVVMAANSSRFLFTWLGTGIGGLIEAPINTAYEGDFLRHQIALAGARFVVTDDVYAERFAAIRHDIPSVETFFVIDTGQGDSAVETLRTAGWTAHPWDVLVEADPLDPVELGPGDQASIFYTSGTTGPSKGVAMPHGQMLFFAEEVASLQRLTAADTYLTTTPLFHGNAQFMAAYPALVAGARLVVRPKFSASRWVDHLRENAVTVTNLIGVMMDFVWKQPPRPDDADNTLRSVYAAPTASSILPEFKKRFGIEAVVDAFGLTETCAPILSPYGEDRPAGAAGLVASDFFEVRLVDPETDREVPVGEIGELVVRYKHPWTCSLGYYGMPEKTVEAWRNLWFHTGDALKRDEAGWYYFVDRYKDALRRRGENISSYEVEQAILSYPAVVECTVLGVPAEQEAGEDEVLAVVVTSEPVDPGEIWAWCEGKVPAFAIPRFIRFVDTIPRTPSEKVKKAELRADGLTAGTHDRENKDLVQSS